MGQPRKSVLITGCSNGGIGDALAQEFHRRGLQVFPSARNLAKMAHLCEMGLETVQLDISNPESISAAVAKVHRRTGGRLDFVVNNAITGYKATLADADLDKTRTMFDVNVFGQLALTQAVLPMLVATQGRVINIGSVAERAPAPWEAMYSVSKAAVAMLSRCMRVEFAPLGVEVIHVVTGGVRTTTIPSTVDFDLPEASVYSPAKQEIAPYLRADAEERLMTYSRDTYARTVVDNALRSSPRTQQWVGDYTLIVWIATFLWHTFLGNFVSRVYKISTLEPKISLARKKLDRDSEKRAE